MGLLRKIFLIAIFIGSTYCWLVLFDHGPEGFMEHLPTYYTRFTGEADKDAKKTPGVLPNGRFAPAPPPVKKGAPVISGPKKWER